MPGAVADLEGERPGPFAAGGPGEQAGRPSGEPSLDPPAFAAGLPRPAEGGRGPANAPVGRAPRPGWPPGGPPPPAAVPPPGPSLAGRARAEAQVVAVTVPAAAGARRRSRRYPISPGPPPARVTRAPSRPGHRPVRAGVRALPVVGVLDHQRGVWSGLGHGPGQPANGPASASRRRSPPPGAPVPADRDGGAGRPRPTSAGRSRVRSSGPSRTNHRRPCRCRASRPSLSRYPGGATKELRPPSGPVESCPPPRRADRTSACDERHFPQLSHLGLVLFSPSSMRVTPHRVAGRRSPPAGRGLRSVACRDGGSAHGPQRPRPGAACGGAMRDGVPAVPLPRWPACPLGPLGAGHARLPAATWVNGCAAGPSGPLAERTLGDTRRCCGLAELGHGGAVLGRQRSPPKPLWLAAARAGRALIALGLAPDTPPRTCWPATAAARARWRPCFSDNRWVCAGRDWLILLLNP